jgi:hypothetical protein
VVSIDMEDTMSSSRKRSLGLALAFSLFAPAALAQSFDGSTSAQAAAQRANINVSCGAQTGNLVRTENAGITFSNTGFVTLPGSAVIVTVPAGATRCVKVLFTAEAGATNFCYVRAVDNGIPMFPNGGSFQVLVSHDTTADGHAFQWVRRVGPGSHSISIQRRVSSGSCGIDDWTVDVEVHL